MPSRIEHTSQQQEAFSETFDAFAAGLLSDCATVAVTETPSTQTSADPSVSVPLVDLPVHTYAASSARCLHFDFQSPDIVTTGLPSPTFGAVSQDHEQAVALFSSPPPAARYLSASTSPKHLAETNSFDIMPDSNPDAVRALAEAITALQQTLQHQQPSTPPTSEPFDVPAAMTFLAARKDSVKNKWDFYEIANLQVIYKFFDQLDSTDKA